MRDHLTFVANWFNAPFTIATITLDFDAKLKLLAFLFVTVPLGVIQWWNLVDKYRARQATTNASK